MAARELDIADPRVERYLASLTPRRERVQGWRNKAPMFDRGLGAFGSDAAFVYASVYARGSLLGWSATEEQLVERRLRPLPSGQPAPARP